MSFSVSSEAHPFITAPLVTPCPTLYPFYLCIPPLLFLLHAPFLTISYSFSVQPGLLWSIQSCNHGPCPSIILSFMFSPDSLLLSLPKGSPESPNPLFSRFLCLSMYPSVCYLSLAPCVFLQWRNTHTNHSVSTRSPILPLTSLSLHNLSHSVSLCLEHLRWEQFSHHFSSTPLSLHLPSLHHSHHHSVFGDVQLWVCVWNCKTDVTTGKDFSTPNELPTECIQFNSTHT